MTDTATEHVLGLIGRGEDATLELAQYADEVKVGQTVCAFLNGSGGNLIVGVRDGKIVGISDATSWVGAIQSSLNKQLVPQSPCSFTTFQQGDATGVLIEVPAGPRPPYVFQDTIYIRDGVKTKRADGADISKLIEARTRSSERWERQPALGAEMSHLDTATIANTLKSASDRFFRAPAGSTPEEMLEDLGLSAGGQIRNSALVLFGINPARWYPQTRMRLAAFEGTTAGKFLDNKVVEGNAFTLFEEAQSFVRRHVEIASAVPPGESVRSDTPKYPFAALREAIVNGIVHRDYGAFDGGLWIAIYSDRVEIINAGSLPEGLTPESLRNGSVSRPPNPDIAHVFFLRGLVEHWGIGTRLIVHECLAAGLPEPVWQSEAGRVTLTIGSQREARPERERVRPPVVLNERQALYVARASTGSTIDVTQYRERYAAGVSERQARTDLTQLANLGYVRRQTRGKKIEYVRTAK